MLYYLLRGTRTAVLTRAGLIVAIVAFTDWRIVGPIPLGFLYLFPMLLVGSVLNRWQIAIVAAVCTVFTEAFDSVVWLPETGVPRNILVFAAFFIMGMFSREIARSRRIEAEHLHLIESESEARREAEEQLTVLVESSPAAILTTDSDGRVLLANDAAHRLLALDPGALPGRSIREYIPALVNVPSPDRHRGSFRTVMQCRGRRHDGEVFLADVWFSTYRTSAGSRLAAMVVDTSEDLRTREEIGLHQLLTGSRILVGAVSHEIRNVCGAIAVVHANLARSGALAANQDFEALGTLIRGLEKIAAMELRQTANQAAAVDLGALMDELRIVMEPSLRENGVTVRWDIEENLPPVWADRQSLMQVFLNLVKNSERALLSQTRRELTLGARTEKQRVVVRVRDTGGGVAHPDLLFRPFQQQARVTGLGLYLSRAFMRSFRGDLRYESEPPGSVFVVELSPAPSGAENGEKMPREIRILLVDDHSLFRESLSRLLEAEPELRIVGSCATASEALALIDSEPIDIVLLDYDLGEEQGTMFLGEAKRRGFAGHILMVTAGMSDADTLQALESGASGIFLKHSPPSQLVEAIYKVHGGETWLDPRAVRSLVAGASGRTEEQRTAQPLNMRERAVLKGVFEGLTNKEIAGCLQISESSVKAVMQQLFDKTGVRTRSQLVRIALEHHSQDWLTTDPA